MKLLTKRHPVATLLFTATTMLAAHNCWSAVTVISTVDFEDGALPTTNNWQFGSQQGGVMAVSKDPTQNHNGSRGSVVGKYPASAAGGMYLWGAYDMASMNLSDVYVEWWAKMPAQKHGLKFMKIFGQETIYNNLHGSANTTFGLDYTGGDNGSMYAVSFGDGATGPSNDTQNVILFSGANKNWVGRSYPVATIDTPQNASWASKNWDNNTWHHFRAHVKFNSGTTAATEKPDGEYYMEIDGKVYADVKGIFNRHFSNLPLSKIVFFDWVQGNPAFEVWYDDITISTGGFVGAAAVNPPKPPSLPKINNPK